MSTAGTTYNRLFERRGDNHEAHAKWISASIDLLRCRYEAAEKNIDRAAQLVAAEITPCELDYLAYSGFCFWHLPLKVEASETNDPHWAGNMALKSLLDAPRSPENEATLKHIGENLDLASVALKARTCGDVDTTRFQEDLFRRIMPILIEDNDLATLAKQWPTILDSDGNIVPAATLCDKFAPEIVKKIITLDPQAIAEKATRILVDQAAQIAPEVYKNMPPVTPNIYVSSSVGASPISGTYWYNGNDAGYNFDCESVFAFHSLPRFLACCLHETLHLLQTHSVTGAPNDSPFFCEALTFGKIKGGCEFDQPRCTYPLRSWHPTAQSANKAYVSRPTESFAHLFDAAIENCLSQVWGIPVGQRMYQPDISPFLRIAENMKLRTRRPAGARPMLSRFPPARS